ncbi:MAG: GNAT family N-acetyltransferase, partial [Pseudomonadota bacterium]|nr:GNAT family N-acetyltransferase [Pseudomonadota bacterium]
MLPDMLIRDARPEDALCVGVLGMQVFLDTYATEGIRDSIAAE